MPPIVVFSVRARTKLEQRLSPCLVDDSNRLETEMTTITRKIEPIFPGATVVVLQDLYSGFRWRDDEFIFLVEVANSKVLDGVHVVKLGPSECLTQEWDAWQSCRPHGLQHDLVLMNLRRVPESGTPIQALLYADAQQFIGVDETIQLERAMIDAVRFGVPTIESVIDLLFQMYERLGLLLYRHSHDVDFSSFQSFQSATLDSRLEANLAAWECPTGLAFSHLATVNQVCQEQPLVGGFRDPVIMMKMIKTQSNAASYIPRMLRGRAHGDLHGRNVLVGRVDDRVLWPAIYDFADMSRGNWIGWDFVKLETEFKIRAYPHIFGSDLIRESIQFERNLFEMTEKARRYGDWSVDPTGDPRVARLRCLILQIRRLAGRHLSYQGRHGLWLAEYYFLLTVYGLNAARFHNLTSEELLSAALSSGAAAARFAP